ncbi:3,4-dioxygenase subunit beta [Micromonospora robiginosa]|uniref:3,4-dioxygenase subunit beta n=1 Tax=Micromonospora robiginosa TaxID=2749844 RepID=A0A7L6B3X0_9ACTN|nr:3,4-dioxygenase subunit beta [Micromonospora ferruginea]QLQ36688.1 3,4-dioxygenase subunit beta [Micromonospora ferruginea]
MIDDERPGTYQGRALPRPGEDLVDQGLAFDVGTLLSRRRVLGLLGLGAAGLGLAACGTGSGDAATATTGVAGGGSGLTEIPEETNGPYPADGTNGPNVLERSGVIRRDITGSFGASTTKAPGIAMTLTLTVLNMAEGGSPFTGVAVYVWQCDRDGAYSMYSAGLENENYLRGVQIADGDGAVVFDSIFPACYPGRWPHVHFEVYPDMAGIGDAGKRLATSQVALPQRTCDAVYATTGYERSVATLADLTLATDNVFGDDGGAHQIGAVTGDVNTGFRVALTVPVDPSTTPDGGSAPGGTGGPGAPPGQGDRPGGSALPGRPGPSVSP